MSFSLEHSNDVTIVTVQGQLVVTNRQEFKQMVLDAMEQGARTVVVDFTDASYIDSSGLGALVSLSRRLRDAGGDLRLVGLSDELRTLFELTRLDALFPLFATRADAVAAR
ncbi:MAG: anti-sigma factor antagonist [Gemmatimonas sp.]|jgi:anti-sigma B factor antagonist|uniref:STAS domain-containing protein n=1 Tax=Gemmatimonas sp. UBA7669 TaxID=1946568 RepID=UPI0025BB79CE|nr:STAS domain-containing protein [Gemmatimonas sp. UBA7669]MBA3918054.1 anti-sigma factor antagonist [Gemmatimonas sp.]